MQVPPTPEAACKGACPPENTGHFARKDPSVKRYFEASQLKKDACIGSFVDLLDT